MSFHFTLANACLTSSPSSSFIKSLIADFKLPPQPFRSDSLNSSCPLEANLSCVMEGGVGMMVENYDGSYGGREYYTANLL